MSEVAGAGTTFWYGTDTAVFTAASTNWTKVAECTDFTAPEEDTNDIDNSHSENTSKVKTYQAGWVEPGESDVTCHYDPTIRAALVAIRGASKRFRILFSDGSGVGWDGYVKGVGSPIDVDNLVLMTIKTKVSGDKTIIAATS